jgi:hypothetical protein
MDESRRSQSQDAREAESWREEDCKDTKAHARRDSGEGAYLGCFAQYAIMAQAQATAWMLLILRTIRRLWYRYFRTHYRGHNDRFGWHIDLSDFDEPRIHTIRAHSNRSAPRQTTAIQPHPQIRRFPDRLYS